VKRPYVVAAAIGLAGVAMLAGAAVLAHRDSGTTPVATTRGDRGADRGGEVWGASYFPNIPLVTHRGETVHFYDDLIKDKVVAINFMYTSCPDTCPVQTARMLQVADLLGDRLGQDIFFYSITIDPDHDTREALAAFADSWAIPPGWTFLTGAEQDIVRLRKKLGMRLDDVASGDFTDHTVDLLIGNQKTGRWMKRSPFENPYVLANQLGSWLHGWKLASTAKLDYAEAPELRTISDGEYIFRNQCSACHTIGGGDLRDVGARRIGPDLLDVGRRRQREWLERWLKEPDAMLEEKDPLAVAMYREWHEMPMPNLRLTDVDVTALLGYIERESLRIRNARAGGAHAGHGDHAAHDAHTAQTAHGGGEVHAERGDPAHPGVHAGHDEGL
jgi:protein SCO1/2